MSFKIELLEKTLSNLLLVEKYYYHSSEEEFLRELNYLSGKLLSLLKYERMIEGKRIEEEQKKQTKLFE